MSEVRVRIAPSPTGYFHIGTARTALFNWLFARQHNGVFIVRIEDTDRERSEKIYEEDILDGLAWLELSYDALYRQSERGALYETALQKLLAEGKAFFCSHTKEELEEESTRQRSEKLAPQHRCSFRDAKQTSGIIRFKNDTPEIITVHDTIRGEVQFDSLLLGDFSIAKNLKEPLYNFAAVIDDADMHISHVIRGEDHLSNTPKQILIGRALAYGEPLWAHLPLLLGADRSKLSKRHGATALWEYRHAGYLASAVQNFIALLGWHPSDEVGEFLTREQLLKEFRLEKVQKGGAIVEHHKLDWLSKEHLRHLPRNEFLSLVKNQITIPFTEETASYFLEKIQQRITTTKDIEKELDAVTQFSETYASEVLLWKGKLLQDQVKQNIDEMIDIFSGLDPTDFHEERIKSALGTLLEKDGTGAILWPLRAALSGREASLGPVELAVILGKEEVLRRLKLATIKLR